MNFFSSIKIKYKILFVVLILLILVIDLGVLNITSVRDVQSDARYISDQTIPRLLFTSSIKDNLNSSILATYDYIATGNEESKNQQERFLKEALSGQLQLFSLAESEEDFLFSKSFQTQTANLDTAIQDVIQAYETGKNGAELEEKLETMSSVRLEYYSFLSNEIEKEAAEQIQMQTVEREKLINYTVRIVIIMVSIAIIICVAMYIYMNRSITKPIEELTSVASGITKGTFRFVDIDSTDELGLFADTFNTMAQRIKATQESLEIELEKTRKLDKQKTEFLSIAAHQLRTPMSGIKWVMNMAATGDLGDISDEAKEHLEKGSENVDRMIVLINNLLDVTQIEMQKFTYKMADTDIPSLVENVVKSSEHAASAKEIHIELKDGDDIQEKIPVDIDKMELAIRNIVDNAIKYTPKKGSLVISFDLTDTMLLIAFKDTGYGIPADERDRIFTKFFRGSNIQTIQADGSGLGLFMVHEIIENHGGSIQVDSVENEGTTFTIALPRKK